MKRESENILKTTLTEAINKWWETLDLTEPLPLVGENVPELMATAAIAVLLAIADTEDYLRQEDMLVEDAL